jgi:hypothetical protein
MRTSILIRFKYRKHNTFSRFFLFRNFPCIHSFPRPKDIIVSLGLLAFICFCDGWGGGPLHQLPTWGTRIFCQGYLPWPLVSPHHSCKATRSVTLDRGPKRVLSAGASRTLFFFFEVVTLLPPPFSTGLGTGYGGVIFRVL